MVLILPSRPSAPWEAIGLCIKPALPPPYHVPAASSVRQQLQPYPPTPPPLNLTLTTRHALFCGSLNERRPPWPWALEHFTSICCAVYRCLGGAVFLEKHVARGRPWDWNPLANTWVRAFPLGLAFEDGRSWHHRTCLLLLCLQTVMDWYLWNLKLK